MDDIKIISKIVLVLFDQKIPFSKVNPNPIFGKFVSSA